MASSSDLWARNVEGPILLAPAGPTHGVACIVHYAVYTEL